MWVFIITWYYYYENTILPGFNNRIPDRNAGHCFKKVILLEYNQYCMGLCISLGATNADNISRNPYIQYKLGISTSTKP